MITVRQIERMWHAKAYDRLLEQLLAPRPEASEYLLSQLTGPLAAAAMGVIRLDELAQPFAPLYSELVRTLLKGQRPDGGWGDLITTSLCIRALLCGGGHGISIQTGFAFVADLQKPEGIWPNIPARRMPVDPFASAFILWRLGDQPLFQDIVDVRSALAWFEVNDLDTETRRIWTHAQRRMAAIKRRDPVTKASTNLCAGRGVLSATGGFWDLRDALS